MCFESCDLLSSGHFFYSIQIHNPQIHSIRIRKIVDQKVKWKIVNIFNAMNLRVVNLDRGEQVLSTQEISSLKTHIFEKRIL